MIINGYIIVDEGGMNRDSVYLFYFIVYVI